MYPSDEEKDLTGISELIGSAEPHAPDAAAAPSLEAPEPAEGAIEFAPDAGAEAFTPTPMPDPAGDEALFPPAASAEAAQNALAPTGERPAAGHAGFLPFHLSVEGGLDPYEREKLLQILKDEDAGITELDLEPQFEEGRLLLPRISEYACVRVIQELRDARALFRLYPSDEEERQAAFPNGTNASTRVETSDEALGLGEIGLHAEEALPGGESHRVVTTLVCSRAIRTSSVESQSSPEMREAIEALQREMRAKARRAGGHAVTRFRVELVPLADPTHYRILATGTAVRRE